MTKTNPLLDSIFLHELDHYRNRIIFARITSLTSDSYPIECIEGVVSDGNITIDGNSAVRRICSLTMTTKNVNLNNVYWGVTTRAKIEIGIARNFEASLKDISSTIMKTNTVDMGAKTLSMNELVEILANNNMEKYKDYPDIIWFPLGVYILTDFKTSQQVNNYTITLSGKDKMCLLNGDIGGVFNAETDLGQEQIEQEDGSYKKVYRSIPYIIREMIHHYAQEPFQNIIIRDINELALEVLKNNSDRPIYIIKNIETDEYLEVLDSENPEPIYEYVDFVHPTTKIDFANLDEGFVFAYAVDEDDSGLIDEEYYKQATKILYVISRSEKGRIEESAPCVIYKIETGEDIGYQLRELTYPEDLIAGIGDTVTSVLDKIVKQFGTYEYFYNLDGQFVFQAKQVYVNTYWHDDARYGVYGQDDEVWIQPHMIADRVAYSFEGSALTTAYQNTPNIGKVKNDYTVWGKKRLSSGSEIPIHARYAIDLKPYFYKAFDGTIYITKEMDESVIGETDENNSYKVHAIPDYLYDKRSWWHINDWKNYFTAVTEKEPTGYMMSYQAATNKGFTEDIYFPSGKGTFDTVPNDKKLIIRFAQPPASLEEQEPFVVYIGKQPCFIFDTQGPKGGAFEGYPVGWKGWKDEEYKVPIASCAGAFCHRFNGCWHTYDNFVINSERYQYNSYTYQPTIVDTTQIVNEDKLLKDVIVCDWREIIYQMAKDYYLHNHEDDFYYQLRLNNYLPNMDIILYQNGHTGYEQYYHDIEGFWRQLYLPYWAVSNKKAYFDQFRKIIATSKETNEDVTFLLKKIQNQTTYNLVNENSAEVYDYTLAELIDRDNLITEKEYLLKEQQRSFDIKIKIQNEFLKSGYLRAASEIYNNFVNGLNDLKELYYIIINNDTEAEEQKIVKIQQIYQQELDSITSNTELSEEQKEEELNRINTWFQFEMSYFNDNISKEEQLQNLYTEIHDYFSQYQSDINNCIQDEENYIYIDDCEDLFKNIIRISQEIDYDIENVMPGYTNIRYQCTNEENFYKQIVLTQRGFPVMEHFVGLDQETYEGWNKDIFDNPANLLFWFDFFDAKSSGLGQFSVPAIGDRPKVINNDAVKAIIYKDIPDVIFIKGSDYLKYEEETKLIEGYTYIKITNDDDTEQSFFYKLMNEEIPKIIKSTRGLTAQEQIDDLLYNLGYCNENITITSVPIYYLEPNTIISAKDEQRVVNGYYILNKMTIPLKYNGTMQITAIRVPEHVY